ncbi:hypothetical protein [Streptomyces gardneri]|uniref:hypothetical protein n=1 Tax=Streptomyces gardneri TaxID=66892 RepID=UPI0033C607E7
MHERRAQGPGGRWTTQQLVSSTPLTPGEAAKLLARTPLLTCTDRVTPQVVPSPRNPAAGRPTTPSTDGHPDEHLRRDTSDLPAEPAEAVDERAPVPAPAPADRTPASPHLEDARALVGALHLLSPALRHIPPGMRDELARLAARWLDAGHSSADVHEHVLRGLPSAGTPVHRPGGLVRYLLRNVPPCALPTPPTPTPTRIRLSVRLEGARECTGHHTQPMLFRPLADETLCAECAPPTPNEPMSVPERDGVHAPS